MKKSVSVFVAFFFLLSVITLPIATMTIQKTNTALEHHGMVEVSSLDLHDAFVGAVFNNPTKTNTQPVSFSFKLPIFTHSCIQKSVSSVERTRWFVCQSEIPGHALKEASLYYIYALRRIII